jgi:hypothetical protein
LSDTTVGVLDSFGLSSIETNALADVALSRLSAAGRLDPLPLAHRLSPEMQFVLRACSENSEASLDPIRALDWSRVMEISEHHDVMPLVCARIGELGDAPKPVALRARSECMRNAQKNIQLAHELLRVLECLQSHGIRALPYKGPVLAQAVYGDLALRLFSDLDVLIPPEDLARAKIALRELDYEPNVAFSPAVERAYIASGYELTFDGTLGRNLLELQWRLLPKFYSVEITVAQLLARSRFAQLSGNEVRTLAPEDLLIALCLHAAKHAWARLSWICDIDRAVRALEVDWTVLARRASGLGVARIVEICLLVAERMLGTPRSASCQLSFTDKAAAEITEKVEATLTLCADCDVESLDYFCFMVQSRERIRDKARFFWRLAITPGMGEWSSIELPEFLSPLYRVVRLTRLAGKALPRFAQRGA